MSLAEAPSPSPSSSSGSDDFAAILDAELEHASGADSAFPDDPSSASPATDDEGEEEDSEEEVEVEVPEQNGYASPARSPLFSLHRLTAPWVWQLRLRDFSL